MEPRDETPASPVPLGPGEHGATRSATLDTALEAGSLVAATLAPIVDRRVPEGARERLRETLATAAAAGTYAGVGLWAANAATLRHEATGRAAEALTGLAAGFLATHP